MSIQTTQIALSMMDDIERIRIKNGYITAAHTFASLFIWRKEMGISVYLEEELFAAKCEWRGKNAWFFPCGSKKAVRDFVDRIICEEELLFCYMRKEDMDFLNQEFPRKFKIIEKECDHEYLYDRKEQQELKGKRFLAARKYIHRLEAGHVLEWELLCASNLKDAVSVVTKWKEHSEGVGGIKDTTASITLLDNWENLDVSGIIVRVDGEPSAVMAGYPIGRSMYDISLGKQSCFLSGLAEYTRNTFCSFLSEEYTLVNGEEDLGIEGLRMMKQLMRPAGQIQMYEGRINAVEKTG